MFLLTSENPSKEPGGVAETRGRNKRKELALKLFHERIGAAGLKSTRQRDVIVEEFFLIDQHLSVQELHDAVKQRNPRVGYATVYRTMKILVDHGLAQTRDFGDGITRFDPLLGKPDMHDHLICIDCRKVYEFTDQEFDCRLQTIAASLGQFKITRRKLELYATCNDPVCPNRVN